MNSFEAFILGLIQGLTEFLPVSSSGHLEIGKALLDVEVTQSMVFTVVLHAATVLSTILVFRNEIWQIIKSVCTLKWDENSQYFAKLFIAMIPVVIVGLTLEDKIDAFFDGNLFFVGCMLVLTGILLTFSNFATSVDGNKINFKDAFIIGISQAIAVMPGLSRSGATIATSLLLGKDKKESAQFSFMIVLMPIIGAACKEFILPDESAQTTMDTIGFTPLLIGFITAFVVGVLACKAMIKIVRSSKLIYFAYYCFLAGFVCVFYSLTHQ